MLFSRIATPIHSDPTFSGFWVWVWVWTPTPIVDTQNPISSSPKTRPEPNLIDHTRVSDLTQTQFTCFYRVRLVQNFICIRIFKFFRGEHYQPTKNTSFFNRFEKNLGFHCQNLKLLDIFQICNIFSRVMISGWNFLA